MGGGRFDSGDWAHYTSVTRDYGSKSASEIFSKGLNEDLNPKGVTMRESRDSEDNPNSNAIILGLDVTGSMGMIAEKLARKGLPKLVTEIYDRKPVTDPHIMCMAIGDVECDRAPLQVTQFEADIRIAKDLEKFYLEGGGGGNRYESYTLPWYFAAMHTSIDCFEKRGKKGYLFTVGDEEPTKILRASSISQFLSGGAQSSLSPEDLLAMVSKSYHVFHLMVEEGSYMRHRREDVIRGWTGLLGQRALLLSDYTKLSEVIVSAIQVNEGADADTVVDSWDGSTAMVVKTAVGSMASGSINDDAVVTF